MPAADAKFVKEQGFSNQVWQKVFANKNIDKMCNAMQKPGGKIVDYLINMITSLSSHKMISSW